MITKILGILALGLPLVAASPAYAIDFESDVPAEVANQTRADLSFVEGITARQSSPMHMGVFGKVSGQGYMQWFGERISTFGYDANDRSGAIAYNDSMWNPNHMMVTDYYVKGNLPQTARVLVLFHEARHSEREHGYWSHAYCPRPFKDENGNDIKSIFSGLPLAGQPGCDNTASGAYGSSTIMINNIGRFCENCSEKIKMDAAIYSKDQAYRLVNRAEHDKLVKDFSEVAN
jgi:hypothetical protein